MRKLMGAAGFEVIEVSNTYNCYSLGFFLEKAPSFPGKGMLQRLFHATGLSQIRLTIPIGNIGVTARKPGVSS